MAIFRTNEAVGIREDLSDVIYNISPEDTPFQSAIGRESCNNTYFEWQTDRLAQVDLDNNWIEGFDIPDGSFEEVTPTVRLGNQTQISRKDVKLSNTLEATTRAGRKSELAYVLAMRSAELKRDIEAIALSNQTAQGGVTRRTGALLTWLRTNVNMGVGGANPPAPVNGTPAGGRTHGLQRDFTEAQLQDVVQQCWREGANPRILMVGPGNRQAVSQFTGIAMQLNDQGPKARTIVGSASVYMSDFGKLTIQPNRFQRQGDAFVLDPEYASMVYLRPYKQTALAKTGDNEKRMLVVEWGLKVKNEAAHGLITDLTPSACVGTTDSCSDSGTAGP